MRPESLSLFVASLLPSIIGAVCSLSLVPRTYAGSGGEPQAIVSGWLPVEIRRHSSIGRLAPSGRCGLAAWAPPCSALLRIVRDFGRGDDGCATAQARAASPANDVVSFASAPVSGGRLKHARDRDGCGQASRGSVDQPSSVDVASGGPRIEALQIADLVCPHVSQPRNDSLVEKRVDHWLLGSGV